MRAEAAIARSITVLAVLGVIAALYFARAIFLPLALAILLTFLLAPAVRLLRGWGLPRPPAVVLVVLVSSVIILGIGALLVQQVTQLAQKLPEYQFNIESKIGSLRAAAGGGTLERMSNFLRSINQEIRRQAPTPPAPQAAPPQAAPPQPKEEPQKPVPVEIRQPEPTPVQVLRQVLEPLVEPLTTAGLVLIFVIFFLLQRQDLRSRLIRLAGSHDLQRTTDAINDGAYRLSRYFLAQTLLNVVFGTIVGIALAFIGVPNPALFGILAMLLRFVPYLGAFIAAALPITLAIAVDPGWSMALMTAAVFLVLEPLVGQVLEPLVYGHSTGLTPVAIIIAATFWTWLWGPIGLLLSTPLTVCLGVIGRHVPGLEFLDIMIGDEPPLTPAQSFYQRTLAGDVDEAVDQAEQTLRRRSLSYVYDQVALKALILAQIDLRRGLLDGDHIEHINEGIRELIASTADYDDVTPAPRREKEGAAQADEPAGDPDGAAASFPDLPLLQDLPPEWSGTPILCVAGRGPFDGAAAMMLAALLAKHGLGSRCETDAAVSSSNIVRLDTAGVKIVCLSYLDLGASPAHLRLSVQRIRKRIPAATVVVGLWGHEDTPDRERLPALASADRHVFSLREALDACIAAASGTAPQADAAPTPKAGTAAA
ncbi:MAG TPA: AI-2E family transporter [Xanthobacteraceae bacterium]|nr:AI-2E family transporter [Xanthobacteraceae bacterium]